MSLGIGAPRLRAADVTAAKEWHRDDLLPDVLDNRDTFEQPDAVVHAVLRRYETTGRSIATLQTVMYPKAQTGTRPLPMLDPIALHAYRAAVTPIASKLATGLPKMTLSRRVEMLPNGSWRSEPWRKALAARRCIVAGWREGDREGGRGVFDIRSAFPTIDLENLFGRTLPSFGCDEFELAQLRRFFAEVASYPGRWPGLLQSLEPSAVLGTAALVPIDRLLKRLEFNAVRFVDDGAVATKTGSEFEGVVTSIDDLAQTALSQSLNHGKTAWQPWTARLDISSSLGDIHDDNDRFDPLIDFRDAEAALADAEYSGNPSGVAAALSTLARGQSLVGHNFIRDNNWVRDRLPMRCAQHVTHRNVWGQLTASRREDWIAECEPGSSSNKLFRLGLIHARRKDIARLEPAELIEEGLRLQGDDGSGAALGIEYLAAGAVASSSKQDQQRLVELASRFPESNVQRALLGSLKPGNLNKARLRDIRACVDRSPILEPIGAQLRV